MSNEHEIMRVHVEVLKYEITNVSIWYVVLL